jgi:DNA-binding MarR family transcriptional regulator
VREPDVEAVTTAALTASRVLVAVAARSLAAAEDKVTVPQFRLLVVVSSRGPAKLAAIAEQLSVNPSTALRMIERLEAGGMVERAVNPGNRREILVSLTAAGQAVVDDVTARRRDELAAIVARMKPGQRRRFVSALEAFAEAAGEPAADERSRLGWP